MEPGLVEWLQSLKNPPYKVLSHGEDLDGIFSASLVHLAFLGQVEMKFMAPDESKVSDRSYDITLDLPPPAGGTLILIDHHDSNEELLTRAKKYVFDPKAPSTAELVFESLVDEHDPRIEEAVRFTSKVDRGIMDEKTALFTSLVRRIFRTRREKLARLSLELLKNPPRTGEDLMSTPTISSEWELSRKELEPVMLWAEKLGRLNLKDTVLIMDVRGFPGYSTPYLLYKTKDSADVLITLTEGKNSYLRSSIRSKKDSLISAIEIAEKFGGGGHRNAAGMLIMESDLERLQRFIVERGMKVYVARARNSI